MIRIHKKHSIASGVFFVLIGLAVVSGIKTDTKKDRSIVSYKSPVATTTFTALSHVAVFSGIFPVVRVVDGDTIVVNINGKDEKVRLIGIDTPEVVDPRRPVQCFGREASAKTKELLNGKSVLLEFDPTQGDRDKYGRLLRYVFLEDGASFNELMIKEGYAHEYTYRMSYKYQNQFKTAQTYARENKKGLWADGVCGNDLKHKT